MKRSGPLRRTPLRRTPPPNPIPAATRALIGRRSGGRCEAEHPGCTGHADHVHHVLARSAGGTNDPANLLHVCGAGHRYIHGNSLWAYEAGYLRRRG